MPTLAQNTLQFNRSIKLSNDGGELSSYTGNVIFREFDDKLGFSQTIASHLQTVDDRTFCVHKNNELLQQKIYQLIAGYQEDDAADHLTTDPGFHSDPRQTCAGFPAVFVPILLSFYSNALARCRRHTKKGALFYITGLRHTCHL